MPKIKVRRTDILRKAELDGMFQRAEKVYKGKRLQCILALCWLFGKRINEVLRIRREDIWVEGEFLYVRFYVSKKKKLQDHAVPKPFLKRIRIIHPYSHYVLVYVREVDSGYIFRSYSKLGHITRQRMTQQLKEIAPETWWHLFRESLATYMAEHGATEEELMHWFDWDRVDTAHEYVKRGTKLTEKWSKRNF